MQKYLLINYFRNPDFSAVIKFRILRNIELNWKRDSHSPNLYKNESRENGQKSTAIEDDFRFNRYSESFDNIRRGFQEWLTNTRGIFDEDGLIRSDRSKVIVIWKNMAYRHVCPTESAHPHTTSGAKQALHSGARGYPGYW